MPCCSPERDSPTKLLIKPTHSNPAIEKHPSHDHLCCKTSSLPALQISFFLIFALTSNRTPMKHLPIITVSLIVLCLTGCSNRQRAPRESDTVAQSRDSIPESVQTRDTVPEPTEHQNTVPDKLAQYRDTLIGKFNGKDIDMLIAEPIGNYQVEGGYFKWRVFTKNNTVRPLVIDNQTTGIDFVREGDLDGNGTDEWGYVTDWPTSNWMNYHAFTDVNGKWLHIIKPTTIYLPHLYYGTKENPDQISQEDILQPSGKKGYLKVKFSDVRNNGEDFLIIDTLMKIKPQKIDGFY